MIPIQSLPRQWAGWEPSGTRLLYSINKEPLFGFQVYQGQSATMSLNIDNVLNMNRYKCHICNVEVPKTYTIEHINGEKHIMSKKIAEAALEKMRQQMNLEPLIPHSKVEFSETYFCENCALVVLKSKKNEHESSVKHKISVKHDELLGKFAHVYVDNGSLEIDEFDALNFKFEELMKKFVEEQNNDTGNDIGSVVENNDAIENTSSPKDLKNTSATNDTSAIKNDSAINDTNAINSTLENKIVGKVAKKPNKANKTKKSAIQKNTEQNCNAQLNGNEKTKGNNPKNVNDNTPSSKHVTDVDETVNRANASSKNGMNMADSATHSNENAKYSQKNENTVVIGCAKVNIKHSKDSGSNANKNLNDSDKSVITIVDDNGTSGVKNVNFSDISSTKNVNDNGTSCTKNMNGSVESCINIEYDKSASSTNDVSNSDRSCAKNVRDNYISSTKNAHESGTKYINDRGTSCTQNVNDSAKSYTQNVNVIGTKGFQNVNNNGASCTQNVNDNATRGFQNVDDSATSCTKNENESGTGGFQNVDDSGTSFLSVNDSGTSFLNVNDRSFSYLKNMNDCSTSCILHNLHTCGKNTNTNNPTDVKSKININNNKYKDTISKNNKKKMKKPVDLFTSVQDIRNYLIKVKERCDVKGAPKIRAASNQMVNLTTLNGDKVKVPLEHFHGASKLGTFCRVCQVDNTVVEKHILEEIHMDRIMIPLEDKHCIRKFSDIWSHCILCDHTFSSRERVLHVIRGKHKENLSAFVLETNNNNINKNMCNNFNQHVDVDTNSQTDNEIDSQTDKNRAHSHIGENAGNSQTDDATKTVTNVAENDVIVIEKSQVDNGHVSSSKTVKTDAENSQIGDKSVENPQTDKYSATNTQKDEIGDATCSKVVRLDISEIRSIRVISNPKTENTDTNPDSLADIQVNVSNETNKNEFENSNERNSERFSDSAKLILQNHLQVWKEQFYCLFCDEIIAKMALHDHIAKPDHTVYYKKFIKHNLINEIDEDTYYCIPCDICVAVGHLIKHTQSKKHVKMLMTQEFDMDSIKHQPIDTEPKKINVKLYDAKAAAIINPHTKQELICEECNSVIENGDFSAHAYTIEHITNHMNYIYYNKITEINTKTVNCNACMKTFEMRYLLLHCNSQLHINNIGQIQCVGESSLTLTKNEGEYVDVSSQTDPEPTTKTPVIPNPAQPSTLRTYNAPIPKKLYYQFNKAKKVDSLTCNVCREGLTIPCTKIDVINHVNTEKHKHNYNSLMNMNRMSCSPCKRVYYCNLCATAVEHFKELIHIDNSRHMDLTKPLLTAPVTLQENALTFEIAMSQQIKKRIRPKK